MAEANTLAYYNTAVKSGTKLSFKLKKDYMIVHFMPLMFGATSVTKYSFAVEEIWSHCFHCMKKRKIISIYI
jgi:hypothetical protein